MANRSWTCSDGNLKDILLEEKTAVWRMKKKSNRCRSKPATITTTTTTRQQEQQQQQRLFNDRDECN